ncbi:hypothetical protein Leryth_022280 [Lithospermum erythrorhizon]|nr:hypothetical protein Leryth_022280 [Lithospermum erythrorhizon]
MHQSAYVIVHDNNNLLIIAFSYLLIISFTHKPSAAARDTPSVPDPPTTTALVPPLAPVPNVSVPEPTEAERVFQETLFKRLITVLETYKSDIAKKFDYCILDSDREFDAAFNFSANPEFLSTCLASTNGDAIQRICTAGEISFYFQGLVSGMPSNYLKLNRNCNLTYWNSGCEPGWSCSIGKEIVEFSSNNIPQRTSSCQPCCEGFFCPHGLTCMIPCPLGAYCPIATLNQYTGVCEPYKYQLPPQQKNHTCGGADRWADYVTGKDLFCSPGFYCPTTTREIPCRKGHYCRAGSTTMEKCYELAICEKQTDDDQNIKAYGLLVFASIMFVLIFIYNCSDQALSYRTKRMSKSREKAAKNARETVEKQATWKTAKEAAKKQVSDIQTQLTRTFSRKKSSSEFPRSASSTRQGLEATLPPLPRERTRSRSGSGSSTRPGSEASLPPRSRGKQIDDNLTNSVQEIEEHPESTDGFALEIGENNLKKKQLKNQEKGKHRKTTSAIFRYAYGQIEKEKYFQEQNKDLIYSNVISMATDEIEIRKRVPIEIVFNNLTLTLKGKKKHLLRSVTGKLCPGQVTAVMGPSGAGKTTLLSALTGRASGCRTTGSILINGEKASMNSYKKMIGFVPQDDIVHGNLTVEENLWFSACCRLPVDLPKSEKVLVLERVIESLGLQGVRDSLVGTVEMRGISGGQRKRVNVGLEMVMEPSLLILDEPTSGLDSTSSLLVMRALRREALEGVNITLVVHQPSYALFSMFDDLILLAKGGLTVYHGPVKSVEEYFSSMGFNVPDKVSPPDHYIDILEGIVKPDSGVTFKDLPIRWMLHNGYEVPPDMLEAAKQSPESSMDGGSAHGPTASTSHDETFTEELWGDVKYSVERKKDELQHNVVRSKDLTNRKTPGLLSQYRYFLGRLGKQRLREARLLAVDFLILLLSGLCLGTLAKISDETFGVKGYLYTVIAVCLLCKIGALRSFALDKLHYWRESASGMSSLAYFLAKDTIDHVNTFVKPAVYLSMFYFFNNPRSSFLDNYIVLLALVYCVTGIAYSLAIYFEQGQAQLWSVLLPVVLTLVGNQDGDHIISRIGDFCYTKWALEAFTIANAKRYDGVWLITRCGLLKQKNYRLSDWYYCLLYLVGTGIASRGVAFFCLVTFHKK